MDMVLQGDKNGVFSDVCGYDRKRVSDRRRCARHSGISVHTTTVNMKNGGPASYIARDRLGIFLYLR